MISLRLHPSVGYKHIHLETHSDSEEDHSRTLLETHQWNQKLKNELCRNYLQSGYCKYHGRCQFAHGVEELRQNLGTNCKYKTKECQSFFSKGWCQYGQRCNFVHRKTKDADWEITSWQTVKRNYRQIIEQSRLFSRFFP